MYTNLSIASQLQSTTVRVSPTAEIHNRGDSTFQRHTGDIQRKTRAPCRVFDVAWAVQSQTQSHSHSIALLQVTATMGVDDKSWWRASRPSSPGTAMPE